MAALKVYYDREGKTLTVWFHNPDKEYVAEETGDEYKSYLGVASTLLTGRSKLDKQVP
jgi:hypothetical protein